MRAERHLPTPIRLLILGGAPDQAETIRIFLRNGGLAVYANRVADLDTLAAAIKTPTADVLLCYVDADPVRLTQKVLEILSDLGRDLPLLLLFETTTAAPELLPALRAGARDLIQHLDLERLYLVVVREFSDLQRRRELILLKQRLRESEQQCRDLIEQSQEAIAFFQDGLHIYGNSAYLRLFGFADQTAMEELPLLDSIEPAHHRALRAALKILEQDPRRHSLKLNVEAHDQNGARLQLSLQLHKARLEGQPGVQVSFRPHETALDKAIPAAPRLLSCPWSVETVLQEERLHVLYQPIVSLRGDTREHYAVAPGLRDAEGVEVSTAFLAQAQQQGQYGAVDRWLIRRAILALGEQRREGRRVSFFLCLSEAAVCDGRLLLWICDGLREDNVRGGWLTFAISEQNAHTHLPTVIKLVEGLKKIKCQIALDQFTLSAQSIALLNYLEVDVVRLAPSLCQDLVQQPQRQEALKQLNARLRPYPVKIIASAAANPQALALLWSLGFAYIQGNFPGPVTASLEYQPARATANAERASITMA